MNGKVWTFTLSGILATNAWWAFSLWPKLGAGDFSFGPLILPAIIFTGIFLFFIADEMFQNWDK
jgi:hypothetical protein